MIGYEKAQGECYGHYRWQWESRRAALRRARFKQRLGYYRLSFHFLIAARRGSLMLELSNDCRTL